MSHLSIASSFDRLGDLCMIYAGIFNLSIGLIGNCLLILVFSSSKAFQANQSVFYLKVESITNIGLLLMIYMNHILKEILGSDPTLISLSWCKIRTFISQICGLSSLYSVCLLTIDQYLSTNPRCHWRQLSTLKLAVRCTTLNICFVTFHSLIFLIYSEIQGPLGCTVYHFMVRMYLSFFYYPILSSLLPLITTISFSLFAYRNVRRIVRQQIPVVRRRLDRQMTTLTLTRVIFIVICGIPFISSSLAVLNIDHGEENALQVSIINFVISICNSILYFNFAVKFQSDPTSLFSFCPSLGQLLSLFNRFTSLSSTNEKCLDEETTGAYSLSISSQIPS